MVASTGCSLFQFQVGLYLRPFTHN